VARRFCGTGFQPVTGRGQDGRAAVWLRLCRAVPLPSRNVVRVVEIPASKPAGKKAAANCTHPKASLRKPLEKRAPAMLGSIQVGTEGGPVKIPLTPTKSDATRRMNVKFNKRVLLVQ
jgi:hypothetical protein